MSSFEQSILNAFHDMLFVFSKKGIIEDYLTPNHKDELLYAKEDFLGKHHEKVLPTHVNKKIKEAFRALDEGEDRYTFDYSLVINDEKRWYNAVLSKVDYENGVKYLASVRNITERKKAQADLEDANQELKELNRKKDKLFSAISHDLKNALSGVEGMYQYILEDYDTISERELLEYLKLLKNRSLHASRLLEDLLIWSRNQFQEVTPEKEKLDIAELTNKVLDNVKLHAEEKEVKLKSQVVDDVYVLGDANMVKTILRNLIINAIKFSRPGKEIEVCADKEDGRVKVSVIDEGVGMDEEAMDKIFDSKTTYTREGTNGEIGSGLGLDICMIFVEKQGGRIWAESEPGQGSTFYFTLPEE